jgi:hypothetical protein
MMIGDLGSLMAYQHAYVCASVIILVGGCYAHQALSHMRSTYIRLIKTFLTEGIGIASSM